MSGGVYDPDGLDIATMSAYAQEHGSLEGWDERDAGHERGAARARVRHPRARRPREPGHGDNAARLHCKLIAEGANGPISLEGDAILRARGIPILPDILTNAGGVTVSYFEWVQDLGACSGGATRSAPGSPRR